MPLTIKETPEQIAKIFGISILLIVILSAATVMLKHASNDSPGPKPKEHALGPGETGRTRSAASIAVDDAAWDAMTEALTAHDQVGLNQLVLNGRVFLVPKGTKALVLDIGLTATKIRIVDGEQAGRAGWVIREYLEK